MSSESPAGQRLQKIIADLGLASRREAEKLILAGAVKVNGEIVTELGRRADPAKDKVEVDPAALQAKAAQIRWVMLHKPWNVVTTRGEGEGPNVMGLLASDPANAGLWPVGRLDKDSRGMLLLTNDGVLGYALLAPDSHLEKEYEVRVGEEVAESHLDKLRQGVVLDGSKTKPTQCRRTSERSFRLVLTEGRNRQIRRMAGKVGLDVKDLFRLRIGPLGLGGLAEGAWRVLTIQEIASLQEAVKAKG